MERVDLHTLRASLAKPVLTFTGYSGAEYEDPEAMLKLARQILTQENPAHVLVNIGATSKGVGAIYLLAKQLGFETLGIVSSQAMEAGCEWSAAVDRVVVIQDRLWGGIDPETGDLSPTSQAMVDISSRMIGIGGGAVARDELLAARAAGLPIEFHAADMNHKIAREQAGRQQLPAPSATDLQGEAANTFRKFTQTSRAGQDMG